MDTNGAFQPAGGTTGRSLVLFEEGAADAGLQAVQEAVGVEVVTASGDEGAPAEGGGVLFESLGVAVVDAPPEQVLQAAGAESVVAVEPERIVYALEATQYAPPDANGQATFPQPPAPSLPMARGRRRRRAQRRLPARLPRGGAAPDGRRRRRPGGRRGRDRRGRRGAGDVGAAGDEGRQLLPQRQGHPRRGARHGLRPPAPGLRRAHGHLAVVRHRPAGPGRPRPRHALHRHRARREVPAGGGRATASPTRPRSSRARCSRTPARAPTPGSSPGSTGRSGTSAP